MMIIIGFRFSGFSRVPVFRFWKGPARVSGPSFPVCPIKTKREDLLGTVCPWIREFGWVYLFWNTTISNKQSKKIQWNWTRLKNFDIYFRILCDCYCLSSISGGETGHYTIPPPKFEIFVIFPHSLRS